MIVKKYQISCDECSKYWNAVVSRKSNFIKTVRERGWTVGERDLCPDCNNKER